VTPVEYLNAHGWRLRDDSLQLWFPPVPTPGDDGPQGYPLASALVIQHRLDET
jgi:hypothetical protein